MYEPTDKEIDECLTNGNCRYGICGECSVYTTEKESEVEGEDNNEKQE